MIRIAEYILIRIQDRFGIPRWWLIRTCISLSVLLAVVRDVARGTFGVFIVVWALFILYQWTAYAKDFRRAQEVADSKQQIVPTSARGLREAVTWVLLGLIPLDLLLPAKVFSVPATLLFASGFALSGTHTFPMLGPTFKERMRNLFILRKPVEVEQN